MAKDIADAFRADPEAATAEFSVIRRRLADTGTPDQVKNLDTAVRAEMSAAERARFDTLLAESGERPAQSAMMQKDPKRPGAVQGGQRDLIQGPGGAVGPGGTSARPSVRLHGRQKHEQRAFEEGHRKWQSTPEAQRAIKAREKNPAAPVHPSESFIWKNLKPAPKKDAPGLRTNGPGKNERFFDWDTNHGGEIEVYDGNTGKHLGVIEPLRGRWIKGPDPKKFQRKGELGDDRPTFV